MNFKQPVLSELKEMRCFQCGGKVQRYVHDAEGLAQPSCNACAGFENDPEIEVLKQKLAEARKETTQ